MAEEIGMFAGQQPVALVYTAALHHAERDLRQGRPSTGGAYEVCDIASIDGAGKQAADLVAAEGEVDGVDLRDKTAHPEAGERQRQFLLRCADNPQIVGGT